MHDVERKRNLSQEVADACGGSVCCLARSGKPDYGRENADDAQRLKHSVQIPYAVFIDKGHVKEQEEQDGTDPKRSAHIFEWLEDA